MKSNPQTIANASSIAAMLIFSKTFYLFSFFLNFPFELEMFIGKICLCVMSCLCQVDTHCKTKTVTATIFYHHVLWSLKIWKWYHHS